MTPVSNGRLFYSRLSSERNVPSEGYQRTGRDGETWAIRPAVDAAGLTTSTQRSDWLRRSPRSKDLLGLDIELGQRVTEEEDAMSLLNC